VIVDVVDESGDTSVDVDDLAELSTYVLTRLHLHDETEMTLRLVDEDAIAALNARWMGADGPTDVLAFPMDELRPGAADAPAEPGYLGDLALCPQVAERQAGEAGHPAAQEHRLLTVHGILHLLGHDHADPAEHADMFGLQAELLHAWQERSG
jgi:probable rRNA maturation factor